MKAFKSIGSDDFLFFSFYKNVKETMIIACWHTINSWNIWKNGGKCVLFTQKKQTTYI